MSSLKFVAGSGCDYEPYIMFIGEAPGEQEDKEGKPFVGRCGKLLDKWLDVYGFSRNNVYITNIVKVRPENNRTPTWDEIKSWRPLLMDEIEEVKPRLIVTLGLTAAKALHNSDDITMKLVRGTQLYKLDTFAVDHINTYHPSYILRNPVAEKEVFKDLNEAVDYLNEYKDC